MLRHDFFGTDYLMFTIDSRTTRDMDDAIGVYCSPEGTWEVFVAIADASKFVPAGSDLDKSARDRGHTHYFATGTSPMLPRSLEEELSLWPNRNRRCIWINLKLNQKLEVDDVKLQVSSVKSKAKLAYPDVPLILEDPKHDLYTDMVAARKLSLGLLEKRRAKGALVFYDLNNGWVTTEEGFIKQIENKAEVMGHIIVQEMMVLANYALAAFCVENAIPVLYRNHEARPAVPERSELMRQIQDALLSPIPDLEGLRQRTHLLLNRANYAPTVAGHYGLNLPVYMHFTSPIRRYADLLNHQQIRAFLKGRPIPHTQEDLVTIANHLNDLAQKEREAAKEHFKGKAEQKASRAIDARRLEGVTAKQFERATKLEARSGEPPSEYFTEAYLRRLKENQLPIVCLTTVFMEAGPSWAEVKKASLDALVSFPANAVSVLMMACQTHSLPEVVYTTEQSGEPHAPKFKVTAFLKDKSVWTFGSSRKEAQQRAAVSLLAALSDMPLPTFPSVFEPTPEPAKKVHRFLIDPSKHPVSMLLEYCTGKNIKPADYTLTLEGPPHAPKVKCVCLFDGRQFEAEAGNKQEAKKLAAQKAVEYLLRPDGPR